MSYQNLLVEKKDGVAIVTVNRPDKLNALDDRTMESWTPVFTAFGADPETRGVILTGAGEKAFVAGADIGELTPRARWRARSARSAARGCWTRSRTSASPSSRR